MSLILGGVSLIPSRVVEQKALDKIVKAESLDEIKDLDSWIVRKMDWLMGAKRAQVYKALYVLTNEQYLKSDDPEKVMKQAEALHLLSKLTQGAKEPVIVEVHNMRLNNNNVNDVGDDTSFQLRYQIPGLRSPQNQNRRSFLTETFGVRELQPYFSEAITAANSHQNLVQAHGRTRVLSQQQRAARNASVSDMSTKSKQFSDKCHQLASLKYLPHGKHDPEWIRSFNYTVTNLRHKGKDYLPFGEKVKMQRGPYNVYWDTNLYQSRTVHFALTEEHSPFFGVFGSTNQEIGRFRRFEYVPASDSNPNPKFYLMPKLGPPVGTGVYEHFFNQVLDRNH